MSELKVLSLPKQADDDVHLDSLLAGGYHKLLGAAQTGRRAIHGVASQRVAHVPRNGAKLAELSWWEGGLK